MAVSNLVPKNGAVSYGAYTADFASFDINVAQSVEDCTPYGTNIAARHTGSGTPTFGFNIGAFATKGTAGSQPHLSDTSTIFTALGATCTLTLDTNGTSTCAYTFTGIVAQMRMGHARMRGIVPVGLSLANQAEVTETWITA